MSTDQKETRPHKVLRALANQTPVTILNLRAALVLAAWDGEKIPPEIQTLIQRMTKE